MSIHRDWLFWKKNTNANLLYGIHRAGGNPRFKDSFRIVISDFFFFKKKKKETKKRRNNRPLSYTKAYRLFFLAISIYLFCGAFRFRFPKQPITWTAHRSRNIYRILSLGEKGKGDRSASVLVLAVDDGGGGGWEESWWCVEWIVQVAQVLWFQLIRRISSWAVFFFFF